MLTSPMAICATFLFNDVPYLNCLLSCIFTKNKIVVTDSLTTNFVILTMYTQTTAYFLKPLCNFIVYSVRKYATRLLTSSFVILRSSLDIISVKVCTISFERPVNYLCDAWHVFPPKYKAWTRFNRP